MERKPLESDRCGLPIRGLPKKVLQRKKTLAWNGKHPLQSYLRVMLVLSVFLLEIRGSGDG